MTFIRLTIIRVLYCLAEKGDLKTKTEALKKVVFMILSGEKLPGLLMTVIRFVLPLQVSIIVYCRNPLKSLIFS